MSEAVSRFLTFDDVAERSTLCQETIRQMVANGEFPPPRQLTSGRRRRIAWPLETFEAWASSRPTAEVG